MNLRELLFFRRNKNKAFVLVSVLMLGVLLISCATAFTWFVRIQVRSVGSETSSLTARSMAQVIVRSLIPILSEVSTRLGYDSPTQRWYKPFIIPIRGLGVWVVKVTPLDDKLPLGNLFLPDGTTLRRELSKPWENMWEKLGNTWLESMVLDFLDRNTRPRVGSIERDNFINRVPYDMSEMLIMSGDITPEILYGEDGEKGLVDYCTIYSDGKINLNFAPVHVMELLPGLDTGGLTSRVVQARQEKPLTSLNDIRDLPGASPKTATQLMNIATFQSRYFNIKIDSVSDEGPGGTSFNIIVDKATKRIVRWEES